MLVVLGSLEREGNCWAVNYWCTTFWHVATLGCRTTGFNLCGFTEGEYSDFPPADLSTAQCVMSAEQTGSAEAAQRILKPAFVVPASCRNQQMMFKPYEQRT